VDLEDQAPVKDHQMIPLTLEEEEEGAPPQKTPHSLTGAS